MELKTQGRYAVMAMAELARRNGTAAPGVAALSLANIAHGQHISLDYLEQIFAKLRRAGLVESERGRSGGYRLQRAAELISVADIMQAADEDTRMTRCAGETDTGCVGGERCLTHDLWEALSTNIHGFLSSISLADVVGGLSPEQRFPAQASAKPRLRRATTGEGRQP